MIPVDGPRTVILNDGIKLYLNCAGTRAQGAPLILFEAGAGNGEDSWKDVQEILLSQQIGRFCAYTHHGKTIRKTFWQNTDYFHEALLKSNETGPYILVGHSLGGYFIRHFEHKYPKEVVGMIFVDSTLISNPELVDQVLQISTKYRPIILWKKIIIMISEAIYGIQHLGRYAKELNNSLAIDDSLRSREIPVIVLEANPAIMYPTDLRNNMPLHAQNIMDTYFTTLAQEREELVSKKENYIHVDCGHNVPHENPKSIVDAILSILEQIQEKEAY